MLTQINLTISEDLKRKLEEIAKTQNLSFNSLIILILEKELKKYENIYKDTTRNERKFNWNSQKKRLDKKQAPNKHT